MKFSFCIKNHNGGAHHIADTVRLVKYGLESCGHELKINYNLVNSNDCINIIMDGIEENFYQEILNLINSGGRFILIATEYAGNNTFNDFLKEQEYQKLSYWKRRYSYFKSAINYSIACWHLSEREVPIYKRDFNFSRVFYLPHGYHEGIDRVVHHKEKDIDVIFTGAETPYRVKVLESLAEKGLIVYSENHKIPDYMREELIGRAKLALHIKQSEAFPYPSNSRFAYHVNNSSLLLTEECEDSCDIDPYVFHAPAGKEFEEAIFNILENYGTEHAYKIKEQYKQEKPLKEEFSKLIDQTFFYV